MRVSISPLALSLLCAFPSAHAAEPALLTTVSVTAKGYAADDLETPIATIVLDRDQLLRRNAQNVGEALRGEPGLAVNSDGAQGQNPVIRGLKKESIVLLVDGMRFNSAQPAGAIASFMSLGLADRVEAVKGPASVLYGTGALGGVINVRLPQAQFVTGTGFNTMASYDSASGGVRGTGVANFSQGDHALMIGASVARIGDYEAPNGNVNKTGYDSDSFIGQYRFRIDSAQQLRFSLQQHTDEDVWHPGSWKPFSHPTPAVATAVQSTTMYAPKQERTLAEIGYNRKGAGEAPVNIDLRAYHQEMTRKLRAWSHGLNRDITIIDTGFTTTGFDARADWLLHPQHLLSFGVNTWQLESSPERTLANPPNTLNYVRADPFDDGKIRAVGFFVQDDMRFGKLNLLAGLRHDTVKGSASSVANSANPLGPRITTNLDRSDSAFSGSLGASYEVSALLRPYASLSRGFRAGEMRERYEAGPRNDGYYYAGNPQINPEISTQIEFGLKGQSEQVVYSFALWRNTISDYMSGQDISDPNMATPASRAGLLCGPNRMACKEAVNIGKVVLHGFEAQGRWQAWRNQWLTAGVSVVRGENKDLNEPLIQMPADELSLGWEGNVGAGWTADTTLRLVRKQDRVATVFARGTENATSGFGTLDIGATWRYAKEQSLRVAVKNLADKAYHEHLADGVSGQEIKAPGRSLVLTWQGKF